MMDDMPVAVLGAGAGGLALAADLTRKGCQVRLWNRSPARLAPVLASGGITLRGRLRGFARPAMCTMDLAAVVEGVSEIFVATTADAHESVISLLAPHLTAGQSILLSPGRTGGALVVREVLDRLRPGLDISVVEAQSLVFACRARGATVEVIGVKEYVPIAAFPGADTLATAPRFWRYYDCYAPAESALHTGLENIGAMFHPLLVCLNRNHIAEGRRFPLYRGVTPAMADRLIALDAERLAVGEAYGVKLNSIFDWVQRAYPGVTGDTLTARLRNNPAYDRIEGPRQFDSRMLTEDVPTGLVPMADLGATAGVPTPLMREVIDACGELLGRDFWAAGRTVKRLGLEGLSPGQIREHVTHGRGRDAPAA